MFYLLFVWILLVSLLERKDILKQNIVICLYLVPLVIVTCLRFGIGADYFSYEYIYNNLDTGSFGKMLESFKNMEPGFRVIFFIFKKLNFSYHLAISTITTVLNVIVIKWIKDNDLKIGPSLLLYLSLFYFAWVLNAIRQGIVIVMFAFLFFNKRVNLKPIQSILALVLLSTIHVSVLTAIPVLLINRFKFSSKQLIILFIASLLSTFIPIGSLLRSFKNVPYVSKIILYLDTAKLGFLDFPGMMRFALFSFIYIGTRIIFTYEDEFEHRLSQFFLLNMIVYFFLKNIEILASRTSVYGYFMLILLLPMLLEKTFDKKIKHLNVFAVALFLAFTSFGIYKELNGAVRQSGFTGSHFTINMSTVINTDRSQYINMHNHLTQMDEYSKNAVDEFFNDKDLEAIGEQGTETERYISVKFPNDMYGVINNQGQIFETGIYNQKPKIYGPWMEVNSEGSNFKRSIFKKIGSNETLEQEEIWSEIEPYIKEDVELSTKWFKHKHLEYEAYSDTIIHDFFPTNILKNSVLVKFGSPLFFNVLEISVYNQNYYLLMDMQLNPIINRLYNSLEPYNNAQIAIGTTVNSVEYINEDGKIIWVENRK